jgi:hypothetical protein
MPFAISPLFAQARRRCHLSGKVNLACVGIGNRGAEIINELNRTGLANIVALCDVDMGAKHTAGTLKKFPDAQRFQDFRKMFDKMGKDIDAVCIGTPDFSHFPIAMLAMSLGKHVYVEKPMAHTSNRWTDDGRREKIQGRLPDGQPGHSEANYFQFKAWTEAGIIKNVTKITAFMNNPRRWHGKTFPISSRAQPIPETMDWDCWPPPPASIPTTVGYHNGEWRSWFDFGNGALGDWGAHIIRHRARFLNLGLPTEVVPTLEGHSRFIFPAGLHAVFKFPAAGAMPPVELTWYDGTRRTCRRCPQLRQAVVDPNIPPPSTGKHRHQGAAARQGHLRRRAHLQGRLPRLHAADHPEATRPRTWQANCRRCPKSPSNHFELPARLQGRGNLPLPSPSPARCARPWISASSPSRSTASWNSTPPRAASPTTNWPTNCSRARRRARNGSSSTKVVIGNEPADEPSKNHFSAAAVPLTGAREFPAPSPLES